MINTSTVNPAFLAGDEVILVGGTYQGTPGVFLHLKEDTKWADIQERSGAVRSHPIEWLAHAPDGAHSSSAPITY
ncbi:MAG TPA: hypothetical protein VKU01_37105 [Bryobacteraceae bacterium]|nr:hypothetical protein [Bryobacteraceae bacterium]